MTADGGRWRFAVLRLGVAVLAVVLAVRVLHIQVFRHDEFHAIGQGQWWQESAIPAVRGDLLDRRGRPQAISVITWSVGVAGSLVEDAGELASTLGPILDCDTGRLERRLVQAGDAHVVLDREVVLTREQKTTLRRFKAVTVDTVRSRVYPANGVGASYIGFCRQGPDTTISTGLEHSLRHVLAGKPGRSQAVATAIPGRDLGHVVVREAVHGHDVVLTLDGELQAIAERRLAEAVERYGAKGGSVLVMTPTGGDVLAAASWPLVADRDARQEDGAVWQNRNFNWMFEPGSVAKIFTTASLLRHAAIDTGSIFDCSDPWIDGVKITNDGDHQYGDLALLPAFAKSSNIYFARAVANLGTEEFHRDLLDFGFGQLTGAPYPGQPRGLLREPSRWSGRSKPTLAIGQELAVTPLQLGLAVCAVANGGTLYAPRLVREMRDPVTGRLERCPEVALRRVMAEPLAALLRQAMGRVVEQGTGIGTRLDWIDIGGKTGTAQKSCDGRGYTRGAYVSSFAAIVPWQDPRLVVLTVLDEPRGVHHYAAESTVPLCRDILEDVRRSTDWLTDAPGGRTIIRTDDRWARAGRVPDVLHLSSARAVQRLAAAGLAATGAEREGVVVDQVPAAGTRCSEGSSVELVVAGRSDPGTGNALCPDFSGLSNRQVRGLAARLGIPVRIAGAGYVKNQTPRPGTVLDRAPVILRMEAPWR
ncbi:MAG: PASTA domain-containing protein [bacterium]|nr:PASTA domain-containing protein [bacterium]